MKLLLDSFVREFAMITGLTARFDPEYLTALRGLLAYLETKTLSPFSERRRRFLSHINWKLRLNSRALGDFYGAAARHGITFHYHFKRQIQQAFDLSDESLLSAVLATRGVPREVTSVLRQLFRPIDAKDTIANLKAECREPKRLRREKGERDIEAEIIKANFSAFMWGSLPEQDMHAHFDPHFQDVEYRESFWEQLQLRLPQLFNRKHSLDIIRLNQNLADSSGGLKGLTSLACEHVREAYKKINNYGFLAVLLDQIELNGRNVIWELAADITLFAEKHRELKLERAYFRWKDIREQTLDHIKGLDESKAQFNLVNEGFTYRDCFVIHSANGKALRLLLVFQKNQRDETLIQCPACRSGNVQGNSYSSLGVRSWECNNLLCPDRSKYNRGKRYSFRGLVMQQAIDEGSNQIPVSSTRLWSRDVVGNVGDAETIEMLLRHYSMHGDIVHVTNWPVCSQKLGRKIVEHAVGETSEENQTADFWGSAFFARYVSGPREGRRPGTEAPKNFGTDDFQVFNGESSQVLRTFPTAIFDAAVTSPPYYNAREYAQWPNIYCYLNDMFRVNTEVFRTLKPGAAYLYNIFDYFDNEKAVVFSAMGQKRIILSAYTVDLFRRIGFELIGNIVWDKGEIEGKRGFNAGNFSPYYQAPFNCWEHILIFKKPGGRLPYDMRVSRLTNTVLRQQPVMKMVKGKNVHGHSAPFPDAIPELAVNLVTPGGRILDPFAGSLTTGRVATKLGARAVCIERSEEYCRLGMKIKAADDASRQADERVLEFSFKN